MVGTEQTAPSTTSEPTTDSAMYTPQVGPNGGRHVRARARVITCLTLSAAVLVAASCSSDDAAAPSTVAPSTTAAPVDEAPETTMPATTEASETTVPATTEAPATTAAEAEATELLVFKGTYTHPNDSVRAIPGGVGGAQAFTSSIALEGDLVGTGAFVGSITPPDGSTGSIEGAWVFGLSSPNLGEGLLAVQQWNGVMTSTDITGTGEVIGVSGAFADLVGTMTAAGSPGAQGAGTYVIELQPAAPSPTSSAPTETIPIEFVATGTPDTVWNREREAHGGGFTVTGDVVGSLGYRGGAVDPATPDQLETIGVCTCTLAGGGDGLFIIQDRGVYKDGTYTAESEFFGISGAFAGLRGRGTNDGVGNINTFRYELTR